MALINKLTAIADAIRGKTGKTDEMTLDQMVMEIEGITTGGGGDNSVLLSIVERTGTDLVIPEATKIGRCAFRAWYELKSISANNALSVEEYAFFDCGNLKTVSLPLAQDFGNQLFKNCLNLESVYFPEAKNTPHTGFDGCTSLTSASFPKATYVTARSFRTSSLVNIDIPSAIDIGAEAFSGSSIGKLVLRNNAVCSLANVNAFNGTPFASGGTGGTVYVPQALISQYQQATNWSTLYAAGTCNFVAIEGSEYE